MNISLEIQTYKVISTSQRLQTSLSR